MSKLIFRASSVGKLMAYPEKDTLSDGAKSYLNELASQIILDWQPSLDLMLIEKGRTVEDRCIALLNQVTGEFYTKNSERLTSELFTGEWDIDDDCKKSIIDIKAAYSKKTFPMFLKADDRKMYEWQLDVYMLLKDYNRSGLAYCLVDTPEHLIKKGDPIDWHIVGHIDPKYRVTMLDRERDATREKQLIAKATTAQYMLAELLDKRGFKPV